MARKHTNVFSLAFLDIMFCGFGAVILFFMIINTGSVRKTDERIRQLTAEAMLQEEEVLDQTRNLVVLRNTLEEVLEQQVEAQGRSRRIIAEVSVRNEELAEYQRETLAKRESVEKLKADIASLEEENKRLEGASHSQEDQGDALRTVSGEGDRQYLTGLKVGGKHILILVDASASMLGETVVDVLRRRNMKKGAQRRAPKWQRAVKTVEWLASQIPPESRFQIIAFDTQATEMLAGTGSDWLDASASEQLNKSIETLHELVPAGGTSLHNAIVALKALRPPPDNVYLLTDGLPTQGKSSPFLSTVSADAREKHFDAAMRLLPSSIPMNVLLFPMEGDPLASVAYWHMANRSGGALVSPSRDWP